MRSEIIVRAEIMADHKWPEAPEERGYLANQHVHIFKITARAPVSHSDRQIEFHDLGEELNRAVRRIADHRMNGLATFGDMSCEQIGEKVLELMPQLSSVIVSEDGQFDAEVFRETADVQDDDQDDDLGPYRVYLASSSKGDRSLLRDVAKELASLGYMVFVPCLGFWGVETPEVRPYIMSVCLNTLSTWAQALFVLDEGIPSKGCEIECDLAKSLDIPINLISRGEMNAISLD